MMASRTLTITSGGAATAAAAAATQESPLHPSLEQGKAYLDALPYVDGEMDHVTRAHVDRLVLEEMQNPRFPRKYVGHPVSQSVGLLVWRVGVCVRSPRGGWDVRARALSRPPLSAI